MNQEYVEADSRLLCFLLDRSGAQERKDPLLGLGQCRKDGTFWIWLRGKGEMRTGSTAHHTGGL